MTPLLIKFASRSRPRLFAETFARWNAIPADVRFIVSIDRDDEGLATYLEFLKGIPNAQTFVGQSSCKVEAINRDMDQAGEWTAVAVAADDMLPQRTDYAAEIMRLMAEHFPHTDGVLHLNDGRVGERCNTMPVLGRKFWERTGYIFNPEYLSVYCDEELGEVANRMGKSVYVPECLIAHKWTDVTGYDALNRRNEDRKLYEADSKTFRLRQSRGFPTRPVPVPAGR